MSNPDRPDFSYLLDLDPLYPGPAAYGLSGEELRLLDREGLAQDLDLYLAQPVRRMLAATIDLEDVEPENN